MDLRTARTIIGNTDMSDDALTVLLLKARKQAVNHHFWDISDVPTEEELERFYDRYEFEIYDVAKAISISDARGGLISHSELGISMSWGKTGQQSIDEALSAIPPKTYVGIGGGNGTETV